MNLIKQSKSIIPALDVPSLAIAERIVKHTADNPKVGALKIGFSLVLKYDLSTVVDTIREFTDKPIIYDHQKAGTDVPHTGKAFAQVCKDSGVDSVILFPLSGPATQEAWIKACQDSDLHVIIGGMMTHPGFLAGDVVGGMTSNKNVIMTESGYIRSSAPWSIYSLAIGFGVNDFVVPGNKSEFIIRFKKEYPDSILYSPGLVSQGGDISESGKAAGDNWHAIVGRAIINEPLDTISDKVNELTAQL